jgi:hypothetical protein
MPTLTRWRAKSACADCPFNKAGEGKHLRDSLGQVRWRSILASLRKMEHFVCHKTSDETGNGSNLLCAGAIAWQEKHGCVSTFQQIMERLTLIRLKKKSSR